MKEQKNIIDMADKLEEKKQFGHASHRYEPKIKI
jgi:hypothetical protein